MSRRNRAPSSLGPLQDLLDAGRLPLSDACRAIRALHGMSQDGFAKRVGVNRKVVKALETGRGNPRRESLERIAAAAGLRIGFVSGAAISIMDSRERLAEEKARRDQDATALRQGASGKDLYEKNAMSLGGVSLRLPRIA